MSALTPQCPVLVADDKSLYIPIPGHPEMRLTPLSEKDIDDVIALFNHPQVGKWACRRPFPYTREHTGFMLSQIPPANTYLSRISASLPSPPANTDMDLFPLGALRVVDTGRLVGYAFAGTSTRDAQGGLEMAYDLQPELWGQGLGKAMILALTEFARWSGVKRVVAFCEPDNAASGAVLQKCGFSKYAVKDVAWPEEKGGGSRELHGYEAFL